MRLSRYIKWRESCTSRVVLPAPVSHCTISCVKSSEAIAATHFSHLQCEILGFTRLGFPEEAKSYVLPTFRFKKPYDPSLVRRVDFQGPVKFELWFLTYTVDSR